MEESTPPDLPFIAGQLRQIQSDMGGMRNDIAVLTAIAVRQDGTLAALLGEVRALNMASRVRDPESAS